MTVCAVNSKSQNSLIKHDDPLQKPLVNPSWLPAISSAIMALGVHNIITAINRRNHAQNWGEKEFFQSSLYIASEGFGVAGGVAELIAEGNRRSLMPAFVGKIPFSFIGDITTLTYSLLKAVMSMGDYNKNFDSYHLTDSPQKRHKYAWQGFSKMLSTAFYVSLAALTALHLGAITASVVMSSAFVAYLTTFLAISAFGSIVGSVVIDAHVRNRYSHV